MTKTEKAQRLVDEGRVEIWGRTEYAVRAFVSDGPSKMLTVFYPYGHYYCECAGPIIHFDTDDLCAHALAVKLAVEKESAK